MSKETGNGTDHGGLIYIMRDYESTRACVHTDEEQEDE